MDDDALAVKRSAGLHVGWLLPYAATPMALVCFWWLTRIDLISAQYRTLVGILLVGGAVNGVAMVAVRNASSNLVRVGVRAVSATALTTTVVYAMGWGPAIAIGYTLGIADIIHSEDADGWWISAVSMAIGLVVGQTLVALHIAPTLIDISLSHAIAVGNFVCAVILLRLFAASTKTAVDARHEVAARELRFRSLVQHASDVIAVIDLDGQIEYVSPAIEGLLGLNPEACVGSDIGSLFSDRRRSNGLGDLRQVFAGSPAGSPIRLEVELPHVSGATKVVEVTLTQLDDHSFIANIHDLTERRELENALRRQAHTDVLTGLANRASITEQLDAALHRSLTTVMYIDLDGFKKVNDELGHERGDAVLIEAARRIAHTLGADGVVGRLGGDEFLAVIQNKPVGAVLELGACILDALTAPWPSSEAISASIGIACSHEFEAADHLLHRADQAMYEAKNNGRAHCRLAA